MIITHLGPRGTFTEEAAENLADGGELQPLVSLEAVAKSLAEEADYGVMAYYNMLEGVVQECLDLIYENDLFIVGAHRVPIKISVGGFSRDRVYSHPKALAQCSEWLTENVPDAVLIPVTSTAAGAEEVKKAGRGYALASKTAIIGSGLELVEEDIGNRRGGRSNYTDFYLVATEEGGEYQEGLRYQTMVAITPREDRAGILAGILEKVAHQGINNSKIHSRPALDAGGMDEAQMFYLEMDIHKDSDGFRRCVDSLKSNEVRVLGSYKRPGF
tara:strand:+ start:173 stop:988 length:816 start_codon:yes stop_codon:yes gene_type:complete